MELIKGIIKTPRISRNVRPDLLMFLYVKSLWTLWFFSSLEKKKFLEFSRSFSSSDKTTFWNLRLISPISSSLMIVFGWEDLEKDGFLVLVVSKFRIFQKKINFVEKINEISKKKYIEISLFLAEKEPWGILHIVKNEFYKKKK